MRFFLISYCPLTLLMMLTCLSNLSYTSNLPDWYNLAKPLADEGKEEGKGNEERGLLDAIQICDSGTMKQGIPKFNTKSLLQMDPPKFLPGFKNPCWVECMDEGKSMYSNNIYYQKHPFHNALDVARDTFMSEGRTWRLRCLPYFYMVGMPKCGTTELYAKMATHPEITVPIIKELMYWPYKRLQKNGDEVATFRDYLDLFDSAADFILKHTTFDPLTGHMSHDIIVGDGTPTLLTDNLGWRHYPENEGLLEPNMTNADYIHHVTPDAKLIIILRNPLDRIYSAYKFFETDLNSNKSVEDFHEKVKDALDNFHACTQAYPLRRCVYDLNTGFISYLTIGLYNVFLADWMKVFRKEQFHILRLEDYSADKLKHLEGILKFLGIDYRSYELMQNVRKEGSANTGKLSLGDMLPETRTMLELFYAPFNRELAQMLSDTAYLWSD